MSIVVTPIPRLIDLAAPAFTLGTANAAGSAETAIASDSTLLVFDTTLPAATGTAAVGTATTAPRRDHVHAGTTLAAPSLTLGTVNSAGSASTALATDSTLLAFDTTDPAAVAASAVVGSATTAPRRDHVHPGVVSESGTFTPIITDNGGTQGTYTRQEGNYTKTGDSVSYTIDIIVNSLGSMTGGDYCRIGGLPFVSGSGDKAFAVGYGNSLAITAGNYVSGWISGGAATGLFVVWDATTGSNYMTITQLSTGGGLKIFGTYDTS